MQNSSNHVTYNHQCSNEKIVKFVCPKCNFVMEVSEKFTNDNLRCPFCQELVESTSIEMQKNINMKNGKNDISSEIDIQNKSNKKNNKLKPNNLYFIFKIGGAYSIIISIITDIMKPLGDSTLVGLIFSFLLFILVLLTWALQIISPKFKEINTFIKEKSDGKWFLAVFCASLITVVVFSTTYIKNKNCPNGYLSDHSSMVKSLQSDLGLINQKLDSISKNTEETARNTKETAEHTSEIAMSSKRTVELMEQEVNPSDPKKALKSKGIYWDTYNFEKAIANGDMETINLFLEGGMNPNSITQTYTALSLFYNNISNKEEILKMLLKHGLDLNKKTITLSLSSFPRHTWESHNRVFRNFLMYIKIKVSIADIVALNDPIENISYLKLLRKYNANFDNAIKVYDEFNRLIREKCSEFKNKNGTNVSGNIVCNYMLGGDIFSLLFPLIYLRSSIK